MTAYSCVTHFTYNSSKSYKTLQKKQNTIMEICQKVSSIESHWKVFYRTSKFDCLNLGIFGIKCSFIQPRGPKVRLFGFFTNTTWDVNSECCLQYKKGARAFMMIYVQFMCVTFECVRQMTGSFKMLKNNRNRAYVFHIRSKFIYLTFGPSASFFLNSSWRPPRKQKTLVSLITLIISHSFYGLL